MHQKHIGNPFTVANEPMKAILGEGVSGFILPGCLGARSCAKWMYSLSPGVQYVSGSCGLCTFR